MDSLPRNFSLLAATAILAVALSGAIPASAADAGTSGSTGTLHQASTIHAKRHASTRIAHHIHATRSVANELGCSGTWCGRQFVLMVGIGY
jgi:hypothetical protein